MDSRAQANTFWSQPGVVGSSSIAAGLGQDPNLFVQHAVRGAQRHSDFFSSRVEGRFGRINLGADGALSTPDLFEPLMRGAASAEAPAGQQGEPAAEEVSTEQQAAQQAAIGPSVASPAAVDGSPEHGTPAVQLSLAAPSFTEQLRGGSGRLPMVLQAPKDLS